MRMNGKILNEYTYSRTKVFNADGTPTPDHIPLTSILFTGRRFDPGTEFYYYRARFYDPQKGRFITRDPKGYVDGLNMYAFVSNNPVNVVDPLGMEEDEDDIDINLNVDISRRPFEGPIDLEIISNNGPNENTDIVEKEDSTGEDIPKANEISEMDIKTAISEGANAVEVPRELTEKLAESMGVGFTVSQSDYKASQVADQTASIIPKKREPILGEALEKGTGTEVSLEAEAPLLNPDPGTTDMTWPWYVKEDVYELGRQLVPPLYDISEFYPEDEE